jgi:hypothetical protein
VFPDPGKDASATTGPGAALNPTGLHQSIRRPDRIRLGLIFRLISTTPANGQGYKTFFSFSFRENKLERWFPPSLSWLIYSYAGAYLSGASSKGSPSSVGYLMYLNMGIRLAIVAHSSLFSSKKKKFAKICTRFRGRTGIELIRPPD